jgi:hypothetical protein
MSPVLGTKYTGIYFTLQQLILINPCHNATHKRTCSYSCNIDPDKPGTNLTRDPTPTIRLMSTLPLAVRVEFGLGRARVRVRLKAYSIKL